LVVLSSVSTAYVINHGSRNTILPHRLLNKKSNSKLFMGVDSKEADSQEFLSKRHFVTASFSLFTTCLSHPFVANAKGASKEKEDKEKIVKGYKRLTYLLDNWEKETTICKRVDNPYIGCERTPEKVMQYLGFKSMEDPLFRADKTLIRLQDLVPTNDRKAQNDFQDAIDVFQEKSEEGNGMAFISSWGEANPGGGKDRIEMFIERSKKDVIDTRTSLATVIRILNLNVD